MGHYRPNRFHNKNGFDSYIFTVANTEVFIISNFMELTSPNDICHSQSIWFLMQGSHTLPLAAEATAHFNTVDDIPDAHITL